jgi:phage tail-like protein
MAVLRERPYLTSNFRVEFSDGRAGTFASGFCEVIFPDFVVKRAAKGRAKGAPDSVRANLVLRRGVQGSLDLYAWFDEERRRTARSKARRRRDLRVTLLNEDHSAEVLTWEFIGVRPVRIAYSPLQSLASEVLIESIELEFDRMAME